MTTDPRPTNALLVRSAEDQSIAGVCAGLADYLDMPVGVLRVMFVVLGFTIGVPFVLAYFVAALVLPKSHPGMYALGADWKPTSLRLTWQGPALPYLLPSPGTTVGAVALGAATFCGVIGSIAAIFGADPGIGLVLLPVTLTFPFMTFALTYGVAARVWAVTLAENALWVERPFHGSQRIPLDQIEGFHPHSRPFTIHLSDGRLIQLAPPPGGPELDVLVDELQRTIQRMDDHQSTIEATEDERQRIARLMAKRQGESDGS